jgi:hypothetical protein
MPELAQCYTDHPIPLASDALHFKAECLADHVLTYLNTLVDDVAIGVVLATGFIPSKPGDAIDSMGKLRQARNKLAFAPVQSLLCETYKSGSWWDLGFERGTGARQLMVHNHHLVEFQLSSAPGGPMEVRSVVMSPYAEKTFACGDFFGLLHDVLYGLFGWLDRLEAVLASDLEQKAVGWSLPATCPSFLLPVGYPPGITRYDQRYFPIPMCDGSDELPVSISVPLVSPKKRRKFWRQAISHFVRGASK